MNHKMEVDIPKKFKNLNMGASTSRNAALNGAVETTAHNECFTVWEPLQLRQEWNISNFAKALDLASPGVCMRSKNFRDESMPEIFWQLCIYPGGKREENNGNVSLFLKMSTNYSQYEKFIVRAEYHFYFLDERGIAKFENVNTADFKVKPAKHSHSWGLRNITREKVKNCIRSDLSLHILCQIELVPNFTKAQSHCFRNRHYDQSQLTKEYLDRIHQMFLSGEGSDCVVECETEQFHVHKFVLMAHSEVFRTMFTHKETVESVESRVRITDCAPIAVHQMLTYMYSGGLPEKFDNEHAQGLIEISEKYGLEPLKVICQDKLISRLNSAANVCSMLMVADTHNADLLTSDFSFLEMSIAATSPEFGLPKGPPPMLDPLQQQRDSSNGLSAFLRPSSLHFLSNRFRFVVMALAMLCMTSVSANSLLFNFTVICMDSDTNFTANQKGLLIAGTAIGGILAIGPVPHAIALFGLRHVLALLAFLSGLVTVLMPLLFFAGGGFYAILTTRIVQGLTLMPAMPAMFQITNNWANSTHHENAFFLMVLSLFMQLSVIFTMPTTGALCEFAWRWPSAYFLFGSISLFLSLFFLLIYRNSPFQSPFVFPRELAAFRRFFQSPSVADGTHQPIQNRQRIPIAQMCRDASFWACCSAGLSFGIAYWLFALFGPTYMNKVLNYKADSAGILVAVFVSLTLCANGAGLVAVASNCQMIAQQHAHFLLALFALTNYVITLVQPLIFSWVAHANTVQQWSHLFFAYAFILCLLNAAFAFGARTEPCPWTKMAPEKKGDKAKKY